jgi:hypothetical protein
MFFSSKNAEFSASKASSLTLGFKTRLTQISGPERRPAVFNLSCSASEYVEFRRFFSHECFHSCVLNGVSAAPVWPYPPQLWLFYDYTKLHAQYHWCCDAICWPIPCPFQCAYYKGIIYLLFSVSLERKKLASFPDPWAPNETHGSLVYE